jgi:hypothetical protein
METSGSGGGEGVTTKTIGDVIASIMGITKTFDLGVPGQTSTGTGTGALAEFTRGVRRMGSDIERRWIGGGVILWAAVWL